MPAAPIKVGVWENGKFIGAVLYARGAARYIGNPYQLDQTEVCELVRIALQSHNAPVSQVIKITLKMLKEYCPGMRLVVSYADANQGHLGKVYQASNWIYTGTVEASWIVFKGKLTHPRTLFSKYGTNDLTYYREHFDPDARREAMKPKHKYLYPLDRAMRRQIAPLAQPYPKRAGEVSKVKRPATSGEGQVRALPSAP